VRRPEKRRFSLSARHNTAGREGVVGLFRRTSLFDATMLDLPPKMAKRAAGNRENSASLKLQLRIGGQKGAFQKVMLTDGTGSGSPYLDDLLGDLDRQEDQCFVFEGGYWNIRKFHEVKESGNHFVTKCGGNIKPRVVEGPPLPEKPLQSGYELLQDARVHLGDRSDNEFRMFRVRQTEGREIVLLADLLDVSADRICLPYRYRWNIEIGFSLPQTDPAAGLLFLPRSRGSRSPDTDGAHRLGHAGPFQSGPRAEAIKLYPDELYSSNLLAESPHSGMDISANRLSLA
jgi:hypothetical protein